MEEIFFFVSKALRPLLEVEIWVLIGITVGLLFRRRAIGAWALFATLALVLTIGFLPVGKFFGAKIEGSYPERPALSNVSGILVLSGGEMIAYPTDLRFGGIAVQPIRNVSALALARAHPDARLVYTGYASRSTQLFENAGIGGSRLTIETESRNTAESARNTFNLIKPGPHDRWVLVTSAIHMPRSIATFEKAGWKNLIAWPVDFRARRLRSDYRWKFLENAYLLNRAIAESVGILIYRLNGLAR